MSFSDNKYQDFEPCKANPGEAKEEETPEKAQLEKAHLHDNIGDVVHVERLDSKWSDLFTNMKYSVDYAHVTAYLNGEKVVNFQNLQIKPYDSLVVLVNTGDTSTFLSQAVKKQHILDAEKKSENCGM